LSSDNRARRFAIQIRLRYRLIGGSKWWKGTTENISRSGVLFRGEEFVEPKAPLELTFVLPKEISGARPAEVMCKGTVIWSERPREQGKLPSLATTISQYRIVRPNPESAAGRSREVA
jgi:PilZ domain-containing protein